MPMRMLKNHRQAAKSKVLFLNQREDRVLSDRNITERMHLILNDYSKLDTNSSEDGYTVSTAGLTQSRKHAELGWISFAVMIAASVILITSAAIKLYGNIQYELYKERAYHLEESVTVIVEKADSIMMDSWNDLRSAEKLLADMEFEDEASVTEASERLSDVLADKSTDLFLIDNKRSCFIRSAEDGRMLWPDVDLLLNDEKYQISLESTTRGGLSTGERMVFLMKLDKPLLYGDDGACVNYIGSSQPAERLRDLFASNVYGSHSETILLNTDGTRIYYDNEESPFNTFNVLRVMEKAEFAYGGSAEDMIREFEEGSLGSAEIRYLGKNYFIAYTILDEYWRYLTIVPAEYVSVNSAGFANAVLGSFAFFALIVLCMVILIVGLFIYALNRSHKAETEQEINTELRAANRIAHDAEEQARLAEEKAARANAAKSEFLSNMSHDIRTPINGIIGMLKVAELHSEDTERVTDCLKQIRRASNHLLLLINDVLDMTKAESGKMVLVSEQIDLVELIDDCSDMIEGQMQGKILEYRTELDGIRHRYLYGSPLQLRQIFINILGNSVKYTPDGGHICLRVTELEPEDELLKGIGIAGSDEGTASADEQLAGFRFEFTDDGIGMSEEYQQQIFMPFTREDNSYHPEMRGTGLGMAITKKLVELMHGSVTVCSKLGEGSTFTVLLRFRIDTEAASQAGKKAAEPAPQSEDISGMKILVVEDNELNREIAVTLLKDKGAVISEAENGQEALKLFAENAPHSFDLILMDVRMPVMDGLEAARRIRALDRADAADIPIVAMTANAFAEDITQTKAAGMNAHLSKPLDYSTLMRTLASFR